MSPGDRRQILIEIVRGLLCMACAGLSIVILAAIDTKGPYQTINQEEIVDPGASQGIDFFKGVVMPRISPHMMRKMLFERDGTCCAYCNAPLSLKTATIDHVIPVSRGGSRWSLANMALACHACNNEKGDRGLMEYLASGHALYPQPYITERGCYSYERPYRVSNGTTANRRHDQYLQPKHQGPNRPT